MSRDDHLRRDRDHRNEAHAADCPTQSSPCACFPQSGQQFESGEQTLLPAMWKAHEYLRRSDAPDANKVAVALRILDAGLIRWDALHPSPDDEDQFEPARRSTG